MKTRREFLKDSGGAALVVSSLSLISFLESCGPGNYVQYSEKPGQIIVNKAELVEKAFVLVDSDLVKAPIYLRQDASGKYIALLMKCTHNGTQLKPEGGKIVCPLHGSQFTNSGIVTKSPAKTNLHTFAVNEEGDTIIINI
ncbi:MAG: Rieske (2Fe-2S) protein [Bacteroidetes bacterium]|nr:Rieske (2Fe-2S) protein [Bacteroidota bacterium]